MPELFDREYTNLTQLRPFKSRNIYMLTDGPQVGKHKMVVVDLEHISSGGASNGHREAHALLHHSDLAYSHGEHPELRGEGQITLLGDCNGRRRGEEG